MIDQKEFSKAITQAYFRGVKFTALLAIAIFMVFQGTPRAEAMTVNSVVAPNGHCKLISSQWTITGHTTKALWNCPNPPVMQSTQATSTSLSQNYSALLRQYNNLLVRSQSYQRTIDNLNARITNLQAHQCFLSTHIS